MATLLLVVASAGYGAVRSGQAGDIIDFFRDIRDGAAVAAGFPIATVSVTGEKHLNRDEILARMRRTMAQLLPEGPGSYAPSALLQLLDEAQALADTGQVGKWIGCVHWIARVSGKALSIQADRQAWREPGRQPCG